MSEETKNKELTFIHLRNHTSYSLARGAIRIKDLVETSKQMEMPAVAALNNNVSESSA